MSFGERLIGPCRSTSAESRPHEIDIPGLVRRLLLFDTYILQSGRLCEFPHLIEALGYESVLELLSSNVLQVHCDAVAIGQTGQLEAFEERRKRGLLPLGSYSFSVVRFANREEYIRSSLKQLDAIPSLAPKQIIKLKRRVVDALVEVPESSGTDCISQLQSDLRANTPLVKPLVVQTLKKMKGIAVRPEDLKITIHAINEMDFKVESNLEDLGLDSTGVHKVVEAALLGLGALYRRLEEMKAYNAVSGCIDSECPLFVDKLGFLLKACCPKTQDLEFQRVIAIAGLPEFVSTLDRVNIARLLQVRESEEARAFRQWLRTADTKTDKEVGEVVQGFSAKIADALQSRPGKVARFITTTAVGLIPGLGTALGAASGVLDTFLIDNVFPKSGVWAFVNRLYPSIFDAKQLS